MVAHEDHQGIHYCCGQSLLVHGPDVLHHDYAGRVQKALGNILPQIEVRVQNVSLTAHVPVADPLATTMHEIPTVATTFTNVFTRSRNATMINKPILHKLSAVFEPGTMTLVLGQPGSGKSSLLKLLSGHIATNKTVSLSGNITYNGLTPADLGPRLPQFVSYVGQRDVHFPTLTVRETLEFAHECCGAELSFREEQLFTKGSDAENKAALDAARTIYRHYPEIVTKQLGLEHCQDTIVGDAMLRGISGGERKRVTTGEMDFGHKLVLCMDEVSTGLDSAATFDIVKTQRSLAQQLRKTIIMALLQPAPEVVDLFDNVIVLNQGYVLYNGPRDHVADYFASLGYVCPPERELAAFLLDIGTPKQEECARASVTTAYGPRTVQEFAEVFMTSVIHQATLTKLATVSTDDLHDVVQNHIATMPEFHQTFMASTLTLLARELKVTWRNKALMRGRAIVLVVIGLIYSLLFYQFDVKNPQVVIGTIFPTILFFVLGQSAQLPRFMDAREIFYKQRSANFYRSSSYVLATALNQVPLALVESVLFCSVVYFLCGFVADAAAFSIFVLIVFVTNLAFAAWFFFLSALCPNKHVAEPVGMLSILLFTLFAGFIITHEDSPSYFVWAYWFNPVAWAVRSLAINQYGNHRFDTCVFEGINYCALFDNTKMGKYSLSTYDIYTEEAWVWFGLLFLIVSFGVYMMLASLVLEKVRHVENAVTAIAAGASDDETADEELAIGLKSTNTPNVSYQATSSPREYTVDVLCDDSATMPFTPVTLAFKNLCYSVPNPANKKESLELLKNVSGFAKPGTTTALMGASGAGKTTLLDVIAGRKTGGKIRGEILLNGHVATDLAIRRATGYCEQMDMHTETATFREALVFSALLRQSADIPDVQKLDAVEEVLDLLGLRVIADQIIRGSSVEQMKRLTIGVELAVRPSVLFLDEPTSGLDARAAKLIMDGVRQVANTGRTVVCTIHQPSTEVFQVFESLLLLKRGGETVYFGELGENSSTLVTYFESINGVALLPRGYNPATWMLEVIGAGVGSTTSPSTDFVAIYEHSPAKARLLETLNQDGVAKPSSTQVELVFSQKRAASGHTQATFLLQRFLRMYWRTPAYNATRLVVYVILALVFGLSFREVNYVTYHGVNAGVGLLFVSILFVGVISFKSVQPLLFDDRRVFYRERAAQTYSAVWYFVGATVAEIPYVLASMLVFSGIFFPMVGFTGVFTFVQFWFHLSLHVLLQVYVGQLLVFALSTLELAATMGTLVVALTFLFMGFNPPASLIPIGYQWLHTLMPPKYTLAILTSLVFGHCQELQDVACQQLQDAPPTLPHGLSIAQYVDSVFHARHSELGVNTVIVLAFILVVRLGALATLRLVNHQKR